MTVTVPGKTISVSTSLVTATPKTVIWPMSEKMLVMHLLTKHLEGMTRAAGYEYDLSPFVDDDGRLKPRVYRGRTVFGDNDPIPCLSILEGPLPDENPRIADDNESVRTEDWVLFVQGWAHINKDHPTDPCYAMMASVMKRLSEIVSKKPNGMPRNPDAYMLGKRIAGCSIGPGVVRPPQDQVSSRAFFYLPVAVRLAVDVTKPFAA